MTVLFEMKEKLRAFYGKHSMYLNPILKFMAALAALININVMMGYLQLFNNIFVVLILSLLCAILPMSATVLFGCLFIVGHCYAIGIEVAGFAAVFLLLLFLFYIRFAKGDVLAFILAPLACQLHIPAAVPMGLGLLGNAGSTVSAACGALLYYFIRLIGEKAVLLQTGEVKEISKRLVTLLDGLIQNQAMWIDVVAFAAVTLVVYGIRRASFDHAWTTAIVTGGLLYPILSVIGSFFMDTGVQLPTLIFGTAVTMVIMMILQLFVFSVDYSRAEYLQYEDDDYYYYVRAIPKIRVARQERSVKRIEEEPIEDLAGPLEQSLREIDVTMQR